MTTAPDAKLANAAITSWQYKLHERIPLLGHRNWIVVADSAYPAQSREGIETILSTGSHMEVLEEADAPGISAYRQHLPGLLKNCAVNVRPHEEIISTLDQVGQTFHVVIIKTNMTLPYTSVFLELDCSYWSAGAESRLRAAMDPRMTRHG
ncbi:MAG: hypothetical protein WAO35_29395 [Terriglobia bacterium]